MQTVATEALEQGAARAAALIEAADALVIAAGAGMGVDSGLPDFRGSEGFWREYPALGHAGLDFFAIASPRAFRDQPRLAWGFYGHRLALYRDTRPHEGYACLQRWGAARPLGAFVFTSNVDGQFQSAGYAPGRIYECHGSLHWLQCLDRCGQNLWQAEALSIDIDCARCEWQGELPGCPGCCGLARPNVLMFGDDEWVDVRTERQRARLQAWLRDVTRPLVIEIGAGTQVSTVREFSESMVHRRGARLVRINPTECDVPTAHDVAIAATARVALEAIDAALR